VVPGLRRERSGRTPVGAWLGAGGRAASVGGVVPRAGLRRARGGWFARGLGLVSLSLEWWGCLRAQSWAVHSMMSLRAWSAGPTVSDLR
jgi:hypothetical protein